MKRIIVFFVVLCLGFSLFAIETQVSIGYQDKYTYLHKHDPLYVKLSVWQDIWNVRVYGEYINEFHKSSSTLSFYPTQDYFTVGASLDLSPFTFTIEHQCYHPVICWHESSSGLNGSCTKVEISFGDRK